MTAVREETEQRVVLRNVSWDTYDRLLKDREDRSVPRFTYDRGVLEIVSPLSRHERYNRLIQMLVPAAARELGLKVFILGCTTFRRRDLDRGFEPDSCFYVRNIDRRLGRERIEPGVDPPPDIVVEIDISHLSMPKFPLYAQLAVPEGWRYDREHLEISVLEGDGYTAHPASRTPPGVTASDLTGLLDDGKELDDLDWADRVRDWAHTLSSSNDSLH